MIAARKIGLFVLGAIFASTASTSALAYLEGSWFFNKTVYPFELTQDRGEYRIVITNFEGWVVLRMRKLRGYRRPQTTISAVAIPVSTWKAHGKTAHAELVIGAIGTLVAAAKPICQAECPKVDDYRLGLDGALSLFGEG